MVSSDLALLKELSEAFGPPGDEGEVRTILRRALRVPDAPADALGNLIVTQEGDPGSPRAMVAAHMDEVALIVDALEEGGALRFKKVGGIDDRVLPSTWVRVGPRRLPGVIAVKPTHLLKGEEAGEAIPSDELYIDIGASTREEAAQVVRPGDYACFATEFSLFGEGKVRGKALDDRAGCFIAARLATAGTRCTTVYAFTAQEEVGLRGAQAAAYRVNPDFAVVLEATTCADMPDPDDRRRSTVMGRGPALTFQDGSSIPHPRLLEKLVETAERERIPYQWKETTAGGNDAGSIHKARAGIPTVSVSVPCRYLHTPCSVVDLGDLENTFRLVQAFLGRIAAEGLPFSA